MPQTKYAIRAYFIVPAAYQNATNTKFENYGLGPDTFSVGLSGSGNPPAQAYHASVCLRLKDLPKIVWFANNAPKAWVWVWVRTEYLRTGEARTLRRLADNFDLEAYQDLNWQTRSKAYIKIGAQPINVEAAFRFLANNANPSVTLQVIDQT